MSGFATERRSRVKRKRLRAGAAVHCVGEFPILRKPCKANRAYSVVKVNCYWLWHDTGRWPYTLYTFTAGLYGMLYGGNVACWPYRELYNGPDPDRCDLIIY